MQTQRLLGIALVIVIAGFSLSGCSTKTGTGAAIGGIGAALLTGNVRDVAMGAAAGAGIGYLSEQEKAQQREEARREEEALRRSRITSNPATAVRPENRNPFTGSTWRVISLSGGRESEFSDYSQIILTFQTNTKVTTLYSRHDGESEVYVESYGVVNDVLVFRGVEDGKEYSVAGKYSQNADLMSLDFGDLQVVLEEIKGAG